MSQISINKEEVLRYLAYKDQIIDKITDELIDESIKEMEGLIQERYVYRIFDITREQGGLLLNASNFKLLGSSIEKHLGNSQSCILLAVTLGYKVDTIIRYYAKDSMAKAIILDACASAAIEEVLDKVCYNLEGIVGKNNKVLTSRFSPGYGDLDISIQGDFLRVLEAEKSIGLTASSHNILIPRKSVTAIVGIVDRDVERGGHRCLDCSKYDSCNYSRGDDLCGN